MYRLTDSDIRDSFTVNATKFRSRNSSAQARGEEPFFSTIKLEKGVEYTGQVVIPGGKPAVGIPYWFENWSFGLNRSERVHDDTEGETDGDGHIRLRLGKSQALAIYLGPPKAARARFPYAPYQHYWGTASPSEHPEVWAPTDLRTHRARAGFGCRAGWWILKAVRSPVRTSELSR